MLLKGTYKEVRDLLLSKTEAMDTESVDLNCSFGRILGKNLMATEAVPPFDRSCFDGYAFRSEDVKNASHEHPVTLSITEIIPAGTMPALPVTPGTAAKILTGAPIPEGADAVLAFEKTEFTDTSVTLFSAHFSGQNIIRRGEDTQIGALLAESGTAIDTFLAGTLAAQGQTSVSVYRKPIIGIFSTGTEVVEPGEHLSAGKIYNSNNYTLAAAVDALGCEPRILGCATDTVEDIAGKFREALKTCDAVISTGGVSVGDFDLTPAAMETIGAEILARGICMKPGAASAFAVKDGKLLLGLSGNPASAMTAFYTVVQPVLKKLIGLRNYLPEEIEVTLLTDFPKPSHKARFLRGQLVLKNGVVGFHPTSGQGNVILSASIGNNAVAVIPGGSNPVPAGAKLTGFLI